MVEHEADTRNLMHDLNNATQTVHLLVHVNAELSVALRDATNYWCGNHWPPGQSFIAKHKSAIHKAFRGHEGEMQFKLEYFV